MGTSAVITVSGVGKRFVLNGGGGGASDLREVFSSRFRRKTPNAPNFAPSSDEFWALRDVGFEVRPGEPVGIVGHNGSGKSTMLKLLTGIMKPTEGTIKTRGRVGALIEVGAGFHPDLTGRENVYLNGSILGLSRREITRKFDEIVDFANLARFMDTPVKRYSSGMYMRLGFAIASHLDPDILLIDEVLAVGDTQFQRKCLRRLKEFVAQGGAVVFVSHSMGQVAELCERCVWLDGGRVHYDGAPQEAIDRYMAVVEEREEAEFKRLHPEEWAEREAEREAREAEERAIREAEARERAEAERAEAERRETIQAARESDPRRGRILGVTFRDREGVARTRFMSGQPARIEIAYRWGRRLPNPVMGVDFYRADETGGQAVGAHVFTTSNFDHGLNIADLPSEGVLALDVPMLTLNTGTYRVQTNLYADSGLPAWWDEEPEDALEEAVVLEVAMPHPAPGVLFMPVSWEAVRADAAANGGDDANDTRGVNGNLEASPKPEPAAAVTAIK